MQLSQVRITDHYSFHKNADTTEVPQGNPREISVSNSACYNLFFNKLKKE
jgi:hypothetical protein